MKPESNLLSTLRALGRIKPSPEATSRAIARARQALTDQKNHVQPISKWRSIMSPRNLAIAAVVLVAAFLIEQWPMSKATTVLAFAEVQEQVKAAKSVQYTETRQDKTRDNKSGPKTQKRVMILGRYLKREDWKVLTAGDKLEGGAGWGQRLGDHVISVFDAQAGKMIGLFPEIRQFRMTQETFSISPEDKSIKTEGIKPAPEADFYRQISSLPSGKAEKLPDRTIDGKRALGYRFIEKDEHKRGAENFTNTWTRDIWVDPGTKLPVRIEVKAQSTDPFMGATSDWVLSDFIWDAPLDRSLFSMTPPEGYKAAK